jgi:hypothetical protein
VSSGGQSESLEGSIWVSGWVNLEEVLGEF